MAIRLETFRDTVNDKSERLPGRTTIMPGIADLLETMPQRLECDSFSVADSKIVTRTRPNVQYLVACGTPVQSCVKCHDVSWVNSNSKLPKLPCYALDDTSYIPSILIARQRIVFCNWCGLRSGKQRFLGTKFD
jgi:hypothetical protein